jgi:Uma2 family endonuclease
MQAYKNKIYTYEDYLNFSNNKKIELIDGIIYDMSPSPTTVHQSIVGNLYFEIRKYIESKNGKCKSFVSPLDIILIEFDESQNEIRHVVQPDVFVVCDESKINDKGCLGAPDLIIEVVSPSTKSHDYFKKAELYERFGVKEYWIIDPIKSKITVYISTEIANFNPPIVFDFGDLIKGTIFEDLYINTSEF